MTEKEPIIVQSTIRMKPEELQTWQKRVAEQIERDGVCVLPPYLEVVYPQEQEPCETSTDEPMTMVYPTIFCDDAISREAANALYDKWRPRLATHVSEFGDELKLLPPVQPSRKDSLIKHLKDRPCSVCEFNKENGCCEWTCVFCDELFGDMRGAE